MTQENQSLEDLNDASLLEQFSDMVRWFHYDPGCLDQPSKFDVEELRDEIMRRMASQDLPQLNPEF